MQSDPFGSPSKWQEGAGFGMGGHLRHGWLCADPDSRNRFSWRNSDRPVSAVAGVRVIYAGKCDACDHESSCRRRNLQWGHGRRRQGLARPAEAGRRDRNGFLLRRRFAVGCVLIAGPILTVLLHAHGASWATAAILFAVVTANFWFCALGSIYSVAPALHQRLALIQRIAAIQGIARVLGLALTVFTIPIAFMVLIPTVLAQAWASLRLDGCI